MAGQLDTLQKLPPQSVEMEQSILGAILQDNHALVRVLEMLQERDFYQDAHRWIFQTTADFVRINTLLTGTFRRLEQLSERKELVTGIPTGFTDFDRRTAGLQPSDLIIIAGRPGIGKSTFGLNIAEYVGVRVRRPVAIFSLEMSKEQLVIRFLCSQAKVDSSKLRTGFLSRDDWPLLTNAAASLSDAPIYIDDTPAQSALDIRAKARRLQVELGDLALIIVDYLQLMQIRGRTESRQQEISGITRSLKALAKELNVPVMALSQLSRAVEQRKPPKPQLSDLRESGAIEQDADVVGLIYRDEIYNPEDSTEKGIAEINIAKQRNGPTGVIRLAFRGEFTRFENL